ncbi:MAG: alkylhydroperoxidase family enzyme, partial [Pirellulaceae bacterium]
RRIVDARANVSDADVEEVRTAGVSDAEIAEIVGLVSLNIYTNYFNHVAGTEVDFPAAPELTSCCSTANSSSCC